jgi:hypothetical protein
MAYLTGDLVWLYRDKVQLFVKVHFTQCRLFDHSMIQFSFDFHHEQQHVII